MPRLSKSRRMALRPSLPARRRKYSWITGAVFGIRLVRAFRDRLTRAVLSDRHHTPPVAIRRLAACTVAPAHVLPLALHALVFRDL
jgi:hypothetical protein